MIFAGLAANNSNDNDNPTDDVPPAAAKDDGKAGLEQLIGGVAFLWDPDKVQLLNFEPFDGRLAAGWFQRSMVLR